MVRKTNTFLLFKKYELRPLPQYAVKLPKYSLFSNEHKTNNKYTYISPAKLYFYTAMDVISL